MVDPDLTAATLVIWAPPTGDVGGLHEAATAFAAHASKLAELARQFGFSSLEVIPKMHPEGEGVYLCAERSRPLSAKEEIAFEEAITSLTDVEAFGLATPLRPEQREETARQYQLTLLHDSRRELAQSSFQ